MDENVFWMGINVYHEARGESVEGQVAVCHVVLNRAKKGRKTCKEVILKPWQFSWHNGGKFPAITNYESLAASFSAAEKAMAENSSGNNLSGADHYFADYIDPPEWSKGMTKVAKIGRHTFFRA